ncbi:MAG: hydrogenase maturation nickel metallochaperone HypA [Gammaproteobacteria bacterium]|nr:hydrogenase maturation nickel metallochaperone HypA [Gammaproteobacteria bacterium]MCP5298439.1 hydrogenase maturation nickel metallochaperone HypA [Chromatiaceae bacterium]
MHELSVCQALVEQVVRVAREHGAGSVARVTIGVGALSGTEPALLRQAYPIACAGTPAEGSTLEINERPIRVRCALCGAETDARANRLLCGACGDWHTQLLSGDELLLEQVELAKLAEAI